MPEPSNRDLMPGLLAGLLYVLLLISLREVLTPLLLLPMVVVALWPLRARAGAKPAMAMAGVLTLFWGLSLYGGLLGPFLLALAVAYLLAPLVARLERRGIGRGLAILIVTLPPVVGGIAFLLYAGPEV